MLFATSAIKILRPLACIIEMSCSRFLSSPSALINPVSAILLSVALTSWIFCLVRSNTAAFSAPFDVHSTASIMKFCRSSSRSTVCFSSVSSSGRIDCSNLVYASMTGRLTTVRLLPSHGADTSIEDGFGMTALKWANMKGFRRTAEVLKVDDEGRT